MNIVFDISSFQLINLIFLESKRNIIMDGTFTKIIYSNQSLSLNSIYFYLPIELQSIDKITNKYFLKFYPSSVINMPIVQELSKIEYKIIEYYKQINKKDMIIDSANDDIGACDIVINNYKKVLIICNCIVRICGVVGSIFYYF